MDPSEHASTRAGLRQSWLAGLALGVPAGFLLLEIPTFGLALLVATIALIALTGRLPGGIAGVVVGLGGTWLLLLGRVALTCTPNAGCEAPSIGAWVLASLGTLALGIVVSAVIATRVPRV